jgi:hypothetical protein
MHTARIQQLLQTQLKVAHRVIGSVTLHHNNNIAVLHWLANTNFAFLPLIYF